MSANFLTKPVLKMTSRDCCNMLAEAAKRSKLYANEFLNDGYVTSRRVKLTPKRLRRNLGDEDFYRIFNRNGNISDLGQERLIRQLKGMGYDSDTMMNVTIEEYLERCICDIDPSYVSKIDYMV